MCIKKNEDEIVLLQCGLVTRTENKLSSCFQTVQCDPFPPSVAVVVVTVLSCFMRVGKLLLTRLVAKTEESFLLGT